MTKQTIIVVVGSLRVKFPISSICLRNKEMMLVQRGGCCPQNTVRGTFALSLFLDSVTEGF